MPFYYISIHALRKESDDRVLVFAVQLVISIHALRKESDVFSALLVGHGEISIHALRKESDSVRSVPDAPHAYFNPRSP